MRSYRIVEYGAPLDLPALAPVPPTGSMRPPPPAVARKEIVGEVGRYLWEWEVSDDLYSDAAEKIVPRGAWRVWRSRLIG